MVIRLISRGKLDANKYNCPIALSLREIYGFQQSFNSCIFALLHVVCYNRRCTEFNQGGNHEEIEKLVRRWDRQLALLARNVHKGVPILLWH